MTIQTKHNIGDIITKQTPLGPIEVKVDMISTFTTDGGLSVRYKCGRYIVIEKEKS